MIDYLWVGRCFDLLMKKKSIAAALEIAVISAWKNCGCRGKGTGYFIIWLRLIFWFGFLIRFWNEYATTHSKLVWRSICIDTDISISRIRPDIVNSPCAIVFQLSHALLGLWSHQIAGCNLKQLHPPETLSGLLTSLLIGNCCLLFLSGSLVCNERKFECSADRKWWNDHQNWASYLYAITPSGINCIAFEYYKVFEAEGIVCSAMVTCTCVDFTLRTNKSCVGPDSLPRYMVVMHHWLPLWHL